MADLSADERAELEAYRKAHVCTIDCRPNKHVAFVGRQNLDAVVAARVQAALTEAAKQIKSQVEAGDLSDSDPWDRGYRVGIRDAGRIVRDLTL